MVKKIFLLTNFSFALIVLVVLFGLRRGFNVLVETDRSARSYIDSTIPELAADWDAERITAEFSQSALAEVPKLTVAASISNWKKLGTIKKYKGVVKGFYGPSISFGSADSFSAAMRGAYQVEIECENGPARIQLSLAKQSGRFKILAMGLDSPIFRRAPKKPFLSGGIEGDSAS